MRVVEDLDADRLGEARVDGRALTIAGDDGERHADRGTVGVYEPEQPARATRSVRRPPPAVGRTKGSVTWGHPPVKGVAAPARRG